MLPLKVLCQDLSFIGSINSCVYILVYPVISIYFFLIDVNGLTPLGCIALAWGSS